MHPPRLLFNLILGFNLSFASLLCQAQSDAQVKVPLKAILAEKLPPFSHYSQDEHRYVGFGVDLYKWLVKRVQPDQQLSFYSFPLPRGARAMAEEDFDLFIYFDSQEILGDSVKVAPLLLFEAEMWTLKQGSCDLSLERPNRVATLQWFSSLPVLEDSDVSVLSNGRNLLRMLTTQRVDGIIDGGVVLEARAEMLGLDINLFCREKLFSDYLYLWAGGDSIIASNLGNWQLAVDQFVAEELGGDSSARAYIAWHYGNQSNFSQSKIGGR